MPVVVPLVRAFRGYPDGYEGNYRGGQVHAGVKPFGKYADGAYGYADYYLQDYQERV